MNKKTSKSRLIKLGILGTLTILITVWTNTTQKIEGTVKIYDREGILIYEKAQNKGTKKPVALNDVSKNFIEAIISTEDKTFWTNSGIDIIAICRSMYENLKHGKILSGASTITQQTIKLTVLNQIKDGKQTPPFIIINKIREMLIALRFTLENPKEKILEIYVNEIYFGNNIYGVEAAAQKYFSKSAKELSLSEGSYLAGMVSSPERYNPYGGYTEGRKRQEHVLKLMKKRGYILGEDLQNTISDLLNFSTQVKQTNSAPHFTEYILNELNLRNIETTKGVNVYTTLDIYTQQLAHEKAKKWVEYLKEYNNVTNAALVLIDNKSSNVLAMLGGIDYDNTTEGSSINMATQHRQPGSAIKPITYALAFMNGYSPSTVITDREKVYETKEGQGYSPKNYDNKFHGDVTIRVALASSLNAPAVELLSNIGLEMFLKQARSMGITTFGEPERYDLAITLGGGEVTLLDLTNTYTTFANKGMYHQPISITKVTNDYGKTLYEPVPVQATQTLGDNGEQIAYLITDILADQKARMLGFGEKNFLTLSHPAAVKTGTTTDWHDVWTVGYTPSYTVGVWVGNTDQSPMQHISGATGAAPIWHEFFEEFLKNKPKEFFEKPKNIDKTWFCLEINSQTNECIRSKEDLNIENIVEIDNTDNTTSIDITSPVINATFELAPDLVANETIVFEAKMPQSLLEPQWILNGIILNPKGPYDNKYVWQPKVGTYKLQVKAFSPEYGEVNSRVVDFKVVSYKQYLK